MSVPNVLATRYAGADLARIWSPEHKIVLERQLWIAVLKAQKDLGIDVPDGVVEAYEAERFPIDDSRITPVDALNALLAEHEMNASDLGRLLGNRTLGAAILSGRRDLSKAHIRKLADYFRVEPGLFL